MQVYFRSDKANMQPEEIAAKQQQASELQDELRKQIEEKKRVKVALRTACSSILLAGVDALGVDELTLHTSCGLFYTRHRAELALLQMHLHFTPVVAFLYKGTKPSLCFTCCMTY